MLGRGCADQAGEVSGPVLVTGATGSVGRHVVAELLTAGHRVRAVTRNPAAWFDPTAFATLTAADFSANDQLAKLIGESDFNSLFHQGEKESMYLADVARRVILVVLFDNRTTLGLVRLKMKQTVDELTRLFEQVFARAQAQQGTPQQNILAGADDEIDKLFQ